MIRILVVNDQVLFRDALVKLVNSQSDMRVADAISEAKDAPSYCENILPDLILMDILTDPIMTGLSEISLFEASKKAGAHGFVHKNIQGEQFLSAIRNTMGGYNTFPEKLPVTLPFPGNFSDREIRVLRLYCNGKTRSQVAKEICVFEALVALVKAIVTNLLNKTGFDSILRLAVFMTSSGYILPKIESGNNTP